MPADFSRVTIKTDTVLQKEGFCRKSMPMALAFYFFLKSMYIM